MRNLESRPGADITDPVHIGGITKSMVAVSVLKLVEEGRLQLEAPVSTYLPDFDRVMHPPGPVTVRQLLQHRSGMPSVNGPLFDPATVRQALTTRVSLAELLAMAGRISWQAKLAQGFAYSNSNYIALALIVERLRGRPIGEVIRTDIIEPLGLSRTLMTAAGPPPSDMVHGYITLDSKRLDVSYPAAQIDNAAVGMVSSVADVNAFYRGLLQNRLLKPDTITQMESPLYARYALGVVRWNDLCTNDFYYGHPGEVPGYGTISMSSADGSRQLTIAVAYPPEPLEVQTTRILLAMQAIAENTLNATCPAGPTAAGAGCRPCGLKGARLEAHWEYGRLGRLPAVQGRSVGSSGIRPCPSRQMRTNVPAIASSETAAKKNKKTTMGSMSPSISRTPLAPILPP